VEHLDLQPIARVAGTVTLPGSKSITNRVLLLAALAEGTTLVRDPLRADDTSVMLDALRKLGISWTARDGGSVSVPGAGGPFTVRQADLFLGNAGTAFRPLTAVLALCGGEYRLSGVPRMHERPIGDLVDALMAMGASIDYLGEKGYPPLAVHAAVMRADTVEVRGDVSSQFLSALLMALPLRGADTRVKVKDELISKPYVEITLNLMRRFGVDVAREAWRVFTVPARRYSSPGEIFVEGDASSASYFLAAGAISGLKGGGPVRVKGVGRASIQGDVRFVEVLERMGAGIAMGEDWIEAGPGTAAASGKLRALDADLNHIPDAAMTAAVAALFADGTSTLRNIASWRVKETDRIAAMANELRKLGAVVEEGADFLRITPPQGSRLADGASIDTYGDHRMAMCFSLAALGGVTVRINDPGCVAKTFPEYFDALASISRA
jgi:3-phosphoshikimate 1-carboxyvinyltransferase